MSVHRREVRSCFYSLETQPSTAALQPAAWLKIFPFNSPLATPRGALLRRAVFFLVASFSENVGHPSDLLAHSKHCVLLGRAGCQLPMVDNAATPSIGSYAFKYLGHKQNPESKGRFSDWFSCLVAPCIILGPRVNQYMTEIGENQMLHLMQTRIPDIFEDLHFSVTPWWYDLLSNLTMKRTLINNFHISISVGHRKLLKQLFKYQKRLRYVKICWSP